MTTYQLPEGVYQRGNKFFHKRTLGRESGTLEVEREVSLSLEEARVRHTDYYHESLGWILDGHKLAWDRPTEDIVKDNTESLTQNPEIEAQKEGVSI